MSSDSSSPAKPSPASVSVQRYGRDLDGLFLRLDMLECSLEKHLKFVLEALLDISKCQNEQLLAQQPQPAGKKREVVTQGNCRIIRFQPVQNQ